jgi:hypothetical protein
LLFEAKDETSVGFYRRLGFRPFASKPLSVFPPSATLRHMMERIGYSNAREPSHKFQDWCAP